MGSATFGARLRELRTAAGLTQPALGEKAGIEKGTISRIERGELSPSWETVMALCGALGVDPNAFNEEPTTNAPPPTRGRPRRADEPQEPVKATKKPKARKKPKS